MATFTTTLPELLERRVRKVYFQEYMMQPELYTQVFNVIPSSKAYEDEVKVSGLGSLRQKPEGTGISYDDPVQSARRRQVHAVFALGFRVTMEMAMNDQFGIIDRMSSELALATRDHQENLAWSIFNNAFATNGGFDNLPLCSTAHLLLKSTSTYSNMLSPAVALSVTGLEALMIRAKRMVDDSNRFTPIQLSKLIVPPDLEFEAQRLLESEYEPFTADNQINTMKSSRTGVSVFCVPYLTDADNWFLTAKKHDLKWYKRMGVETSMGKDSQTKDTLHDAMYYASVGWGDFRGIFGSNP